LFENLEIELKRKPQENTFKRLIVYLKNRF